MHLVLAAVALVDGETIKVVCQVIGRPFVDVPICVDGVGTGVGGVGRALALIFRLERMVEAVAAVQGVMAKLAADLTLEVATAVATTASAAATIAAVAAALSTQVATRVATLVAVASTATIRVASGAVRRRVDRADGGLLLEAEFGAEEERVEAAEADGIIARRDRRDQRLKLGT